MRTSSTLIAGLAVLALAACDDAGKPAAEAPEAPAGETAAPSGR